MKKKSIIIFVIVVCSFFSLSMGSEHLRTRPFQLSLVYPLGTNGINAFDYSNVMSLNLLMGINGGLDGVEIGGVANYIHHDANGVQIAGAVNVDRRMSNGVFISGAANCHLGPTKGVGITGALNLTRGHADGLFIAGGTNVHLRTLDGVSIAGGLNLALGDAEGFTIAPVNLFMKNYFGVQIGVVNIVGGLDGLQVGVVNLVGEDNDALPIGIVSVVKDGYYELEFTSNELSFFNISYKMGVKRFYNTYNVGYSKHSGSDIFRYGIGIGTNRPVGYKQSVSFELGTNQIIRDWDWSGGVNLNNRLSMDYRLRLGRKFALVGGVNLNAYVTNEMIGGAFGNFDIPNTIYESDWVTSKLFIWIGWKLGFSYEINGSGEIDYRRR
jgi:hypothetical protein